MKKEYYNYKKDIHLLNELKILSYFKTYEYEINFKNIYKDYIKISKKYYFIGFFNIWRIFWYL